MNGLQLEFKEHCEANNIKHYCLECMCAFPRAIDYKRHKVFCKSMGVV